MRVYIIHYKEEFQDEPEIYSPCPHDDFIPELQKIYDTNTNDPEIECEIFDNPQHHISEITNDFLLAQPTGRKIYLSNPANTSSYIYFVAYEVLDDPETLISPDGAYLPENTQLYNLGWLIEEADANPGTPQEFQATDPIVIHTDPLLTTLRINTLLSDDPNKSAGYSLARLHQIVGEFMIYTYPDKLCKIRRCLMPVQ